MKVETNVNNKQREEASTKDAESQKNEEKAQTIKDAVNHHKNEEDKLKMESQRLQEERAKIERIAKEKAEKERIDSELRQKEEAELEIKRQEEAIIKENEKK